MHPTFSLDRDNAKLMGVCAGLSRWTGFDPTIVRLSVVVLALVTGPVAALAYVATGMIAPR